jgi:4a-hydroxytetrahydrobiopterin dehydratase
MTRAETATRLAEENCQPPHGDEPPLSGEEAKKLNHEVPDWAKKGKAIEREFRFKDFREAIAFVNKAADIANAQDHHPDILVSYNKVRFTLSTHKIGGLSRNDFIMAAKIDHAAKGGQ